ncbi:MAG TPA: hypothetical protein VKY74_09040 [Chloroflexia bacterium]|nr:hypothetical protein [Chloroflexia bacterium]
MKLPLADAERTLLHDLFDPRRVAVSFPEDQAEATRLHQLLAGHEHRDLPRADVEALTHLLGTYLRRLGGAGVPVAAQAPLDATVALAAQSPVLEHVHAQLVRHLRATE